MLNAEITIHPKLQHLGLTTGNMQPLLDWYKTRSSRHPPMPRNSSCWNRGELNGSASQGKDGGHSLLRTATAGKARETS
jgi:hypothetical protein